MVEGARNADARLVAPVVNGLPEELPSSSSPTIPRFGTARAPRGSSAGYLDSSSPADDMRMRSRELRAPVWGTEAQMWRRVLEREAIKRRHQDEEALLDRRRRDLENAIDPTVPRTLKGADAPTESERTAHEITHLPAAPWRETCKLERGIEAHHVRLTPLELDEGPFIAMDFVVRKSRADDGRADMTIWEHSWQLLTRVLVTCEP